MEEDINDIFESIACSEDSINQSGFEDGYQTGEFSGLKEGYHFGYHRGLVVGKEIGFYSGFVESLLNSNDPFSPKLMKLLMKLQSELNNVPSENDENVEFNNVLQSLRTLFKTVCSLLRLDPSLPIAVSSLSY